MEPPVVKTPNPPVLFIYGKREIQDVGTTVDDLRASYPTCYVVECNEAGVEIQNGIAHRAKNYQLQPNFHYLLKEPKPPSQDKEGVKGGPPSSPSLVTGNEINKKQNECPLCYTSFSYFSKRKVCKMCNQEYCLACCKLKISYPPYIGNFTEPKRACKRCIPVLFKLRHMHTDMASLEKGIIPSSVIKILKKRKKSAILTAPFRKESHDKPILLPSSSSFLYHDFNHKNSLPSLPPIPNNQSPTNEGNLRRSIISSSKDDTVIITSTSNNNNKQQLLKPKSEKKHKRTKSHGNREIDHLDLSSTSPLSIVDPQFGAFVPETIYSATSTPSRFENGTFYTAGEGQLSTASKFLDPIFKIAYWTSGIKQGATFDRKLVEAAMKIVPATTTSAKLKFTFPVPEVWPSFDTSDEERTKLRNDAFRAANTFDTNININNNNNNNSNYYYYNNTNHNNNNNNDVFDSSSSSLPSVAKILTLGYVPPNYTYFSGSLPAVIYFHGGGFCLGHVHDSLYEHICQTIAETVGCIVFAVEYRLAPEYKFPTQIEDCYAALVWVYNHARELNVDVNRIAVAGDSAGGSLAAVISQMARDRGGPPLCHQVLIYPCLTNPTTDILESHRRYINGPVLPRKTLFWMLEHLLPDKSLIDHPYVTPLNTATVIGLPSATIINALHDPLRDHSELYARKLRGMGINVTRTVYRRSPHAFFGVLGLSESDEALMEVCWGLATAFENSPASEF